MHLTWQGKASNGHDRAQPGASVERHNLVSIQGKSSIFECGLKLGFTLRSTMGSKSFLRADEK